MNNIENKVQITNIQELDDALNKYNFPFGILDDIIGRMLDWMVDGGDEEDASIKEIYRYVENFINRFCD